MQEKCKKVCENYLNFSIILATFGVFNRKLGRIIKRRYEKRKPQKRD